MKKILFVILSVLLFTSFVNAQPIRESALAKFVNALPSPNVCNANDQNQALLLVKNTDLYLCKGGMYVAFLTSTTGNLTPADVRAIILNMFKDSADVTFTYDSVNDELRAFLTPTGVIAGTYGSSTTSPVITVDSKGRVVSAFEVPISGGGSGGEVNTMSNVGTAGVGIYKQKVGTNFEVKRLEAGANITIVPTANDTVLISATGGTGASYVILVTNVAELDSAIAVANGNTGNIFRLVIAGEVNLVNTQKILPKNTILSIGNGGSFREGGESSSLIINGIVDIPAITIFKDFEPHDVKIRGANDFIYAHWWGLMAEMPTSLPQRTLNNQAMANAFASYNQTTGTVSRLAGQHIRVPQGRYFYADTLEPPYRTTISGSNTFSYRNAGTSFFFPCGKTGIRFWYRNTGNSLPSDTNPFNSKLENLAVIGEGVCGTTADGVHFNVKVHLENVQSANFARNCFYSDTVTDNRIPATYTGRYYTGRNANSSQAVIDAQFCGSWDLPVGAVNQGSLVGSYDASTAILTVPNGDFNEYSLETILRVQEAKRLPITSVSNTTPIVVTVSDSKAFDYHYWFKNDSITINGVSGAVDGTYTIKRVSDTKFSLNGSTASGSFGAGGTATGALIAKVGKWINATQVRLVEEDTPRMAFDAGNDEYPTSFNAKDGINVSNVAVGVMGAGFKILGNNSTNNHIKYNSVGHTGFGLYLGSQFGSVTIGHISNIGGNGIKARLPESQNIQVQPQNIIIGYEEGGGNPNDIQGTNNYAVGWKSANGYTDRSTGFLGYDQALHIKFQQVFIEYMPTAEVRQKLAEYRFAVNAKSRFDHLIDIGKRHESFVPVGGTDVLRIYADSTTGNLKISRSGGVFEDFLIGNKVFVTVNAGLIGANAVSKQTFPMADARVGDVVKCSPPIGLINGLLFVSASVPSAGNVQFTYHNTNGIAVNPVSQTYTCMLNR